MSKTIAMPELVIVTQPEPRVTLLTLNRPDKRNALSIELIEAARAAIEKSSADPHCRVVILAGAGPVFCAGLDLREASEPARSHRSATALCRLYQALCACPKVTIAAAQGAAMGGGAGLVAGCDLAIAADDLRLSYPEVHRGLVAALVTCLLRRQASDRQIRELVLLGETIDAPRALAIGLVSRVTPAAALLPQALEFAKLAAAGAPGAVARTKKLLDELSDRPIEKQLQLALNYHLQARDSSEAAEGVAAFLEKRPPVWLDNPRQPPEP